MGIINLLSPETIHKIAAGEVIERPANAVKELLENALDAGATKITIALEEGGLDLIRVSDNGKGMLREDARLAWQPHTTSKIRAADDFAYVATYGFRGEALCSMAAVAGVDHGDPPCGRTDRHRHQRIRLAGDGSREVPRNPGTTVTVTNLFLHNPARRKFMGSAKNETARILSMVSRAALAHPDGGLQDPWTRAADILSVPKDAQAPRGRECWASTSPPNSSPWNGPTACKAAAGTSTWKATSARPNRRVCAPPTSTSTSTGAASRAASRRAPWPSLRRASPGRFPLAVLFLTMTPEEVDVNVHPTKKEVRFLNEGRIYWAISQAVKVALRKIAGIPDVWTSGGTRPAAFGSTAESAFARARGMAFTLRPLESCPGIRAGRAIPAWRRALRLRLPSRGAPAVDRGENPDGQPASAGKVTDSYWRGASARRGAGTRSAFPERGSRGPQGPGLPRSFPARTKARRAVPFRGRSEVPFLQLHNGFILFGVESGLMIVNQQAAHERVLYEKALEEMRQTARFSSQQLLFPEVLELPTADSTFLEGHLDRLQALGFDLESFGGNAFQLRGLPMEVKPDQGRRVIHELLDGLCGRNGVRPRLRARSSNSGWRGSMRALLR